MPQFSYNLNVYGGDVTFLPGLEVWLNTLLRDTVFQPLILPEGRTIPIAPGLQNAQVCATMKLPLMLPMGWSFPIAPGLQNDQGCSADEAEPISIALFLQSWVLSLDAMAHLYCLHCFDFPSAGHQCVQHHHCRSLAGFCCFAPDPVLGFYQMIEGTQMATAACLQDAQEA